MLDKSFLSDIESKIIVNNDPYPNAVINNTLPADIIKKMEEEFINFNKTSTAGLEEFQKLKWVLNDYSKMPLTIKNAIDFFYSEGFLRILERKFHLKNLLPDWNFFGGGLHQSFRGGFLKIHSDFIYMRKSKLKRRLNLLLYLNSNWDQNWGGLIELWDKNMNTAKKKIIPETNNAIIFRTDFDSNHGFPDPISCPKDVSRKSLALYYYTEEKSIFPIVLKRRKHFHAIWKKRSNINEPKFGDNESFFKRLKHKFFYRFF